MKLTLRLRLLLMVAIPLVGMLWVSTWNTVEKMMLSREMGRLQGLVAVATRVGALAHELQKERGMSAGFIGSKGVNFASELPTQREATEQRRKALAEALAGFDASYFGTQLTGALGKANQQLAELGDKRQAVTALSIPGPEAIGYYTQTIAALLAVPGQLAALSPDKDIGRQASAYTAWLQGKERAGIERATLSNVFGADKFLPEMLVRFVRNAAEQDQWFAIFHQYATDAHDKFVEGKLQGAAVEEVATTKKTALARMGDAALGLDAKQWFAAATARIDLMKAVEDRLADDITAAMGKLQSTSTQIAWFYGVTTLLSGILVLWLAQAIARRVMAQIGGEPEAAVEIAHAVADGKLDNTINLQPGDDSSILATMDRMQSQLLERLTAERRVANEMTRIKIALDCVGTPVRIADAGGTVIYANKAMFETLRRIEPVLKAQNPNFSTDGFVGSSIGTLYADPAAALKRLGSLTAMTQTEMVIGGRTYRVVTSPVFTASGERLGSVGEWQDRTEEIAAEREIKSLLDAAVTGDFSRRLATADKQGFFRDMAEGMNQLMGVVLGALDDIARVLNALSRGDLSQRIDASYAGALGQLKDDTNLTIQQLRLVVTQIKEASDAINTAAKEIAAGNTDLSSRTEEQASSLEETASSMEELNSTVRNNAESAREASELANASNAAAAKGGEMVSRVVETMSGIQVSSRKIADIVGVIDSIAFQTNILALNAAVEAARAGEQGRGFAVVASEVRNLAQRSAEAAKEIKALIDESVGKVAGGVRLAHETGDSIADVVSAFQQLAQLVQTIAESSREQAGGIEQVSGAVTQMDEVTQQNAALVEQAAAAAESLEEQAGGLAKAVDMFSLDGRTIANFSTAGGVDFEAIIQAHLQWKHKLQQYLEGQGEPLDADVVGCDDKCAMGKWIYSDGKASYGGDVQFEEMRGNHAKFHACAGQVILLTQKGDKSAAEHLLRDEFAAQSALTVGQIRALKARHINTQAGRSAVAVSPLPTVAARPAPTSKLASSPAKRLPPPQFDGDEDEWAEF